MPFKDPEAKKEYRKKYYRENKQSALEYNTEWRKLNRDKRNKSERIRNAIRTRTDIAFREYRKKKSRESYIRFREKRLELSRNRDRIKSRARELLRNAVRNGEIIKPSACSKCSSTGNIHGHHFDYSKPLEVIWLCLTCHGDEHRVS